MASKAFGNGLKELRFLFCQTSEHSAATRYATTKVRGEGPDCDAQRKSGRIARFLREIEADCMRRNFLTRTYPSMKKANPSLPIMIREANGTEPTVYARFGASSEAKQILGSRY